MARAAAGLLNQKLDRLWLGTAFETFILNELKIYNQISGKNYPIFYYKTVAGSEIDFIIETKNKSTGGKAQVICIEVKLTDKWKNEWEKAIRSLSQREEYQS